jgi:hypothetical protein
MHIQAAGAEGAVKWVNTNGRDSSRSPCHSLLAAVVSLLSLLSSVNCCSRARPRSRRDTEHTPLPRTDILVQIRRQLELVEGAAEFASRV